MKKKQDMTFRFALLSLIAIVTLLTLGILVLKIDIVVVVFITLVFGWLLSFLVGYRWEDIVKWMSGSIGNVAEGLMFFLLIGMLIGSWISAGTVPAIIYYGLEIIKPEIVLPAGFVVCCMTSFIMGTSWGTIATVGLAVFSMCVGMDTGIPEPLIAGMIVSGAWFGDKMSPISDTAVIATTSTGTNLYEHIKGMSYTTIPTFFITLIIYWKMGNGYASGVANAESIKGLQVALDQAFNLNILVLVPMLVLVIMCAKKVPALLALTSATLVGVIIAIFVQNTSLDTALMSLYNGYTQLSGNEMVDTLLVRGGMQSMMWSFTLGFLALTLGGVLEGLGMLKVLIVRLVSHIKRDASLILMTMGTGIFSNAIMGDMYLPIVLNSSIYKEAYDKRGLKRSMLSRVVVESISLCNPLIPWTAAAAFVSSTLGVSTLDYLPYAFLNLINPLLTIILSYMGIFVFKVNKNKEKI